ncbi:MAG: hypothetical protein ACYTDY_10885 [Planctomycetota bacterium]|jgi:hypothetical protein
MRIRDFLLILPVICMVASCETRPARVKAPKPLVGELVAYKKAVSKAGTTVGYVKIYDYSEKGYAEPQRLFHVYDLDLVEVGILTPMGTGHKIVRLPVDVARVRGMTQDKIPLDAQALPFNVARCLDVAPDLKLLSASPADFKPQE